MEKSRLNNSFWLITGLIVLAVIFRIISNQLNLFNFTPMIAIALFAGAKFKDKIWAIIIPVLSFFISDAILAYLNNYSLFHNTILFTYGTILLIILLGRFLNSKKINIVKTTGLTLISSTLFFVITNTGVWLFGSMYSFDFSGLTSCFIMAIPFFKYSVIGDLFFVFILFGLYELVSNKYIVNSKDYAWLKSK